MSDRSYLTVTLNDAPYTLPPALAAVLAGHDHREAGEFTWEETLLARGEHLARHLRQIDPDLEFTCQQEGHHEADGYRITATRGQHLREVTITHSGALAPNPHTIADLLRAATTLTGARAAVLGYLEAEGAL